MAARRANTLLIRNLPFTVSHQELREHFSKFGNVVHSRVIFDHKTGFSMKYGFVRFSQEEQMRDALSRSSQFLDGNYIDVMTANSKKFNIAASYVASMSFDVSVDDRLYLYSHYKQAIEGECNIPKPSFFDLQGRKKWDAWKSLKQLPKEKAMQFYIDKVTELDPSWESVAPIKTGWVSVSTMVKEDPIDESAKNIFDFVQENNLDKIKSYSSEELSICDESGMSLLHWASDRGYLEMVQYLVKKIPTLINSQDNEGQTPLHYAVSCSHEEIVKILLENNADTNIKDEEGILPIDLVQSESITNMFKQNL